MRKQKLLEISLNFLVKNKVSKADAEKRQCVAFRNSLPVRWQKALASF